MSDPDVAREVVDAIADLAIAAAAIARGDDTQSPIMDIADHISRLGEEHPLESVEVLVIIAGALARDLLVRHEGRGARGGAAHDPGGVLRSGLHLAVEQAVSFSHLIAELDTLDT